MLQLQAEKSQVQRIAAVLFAVLSSRLELQLSDTGFIIVRFVVVVVHILLVFACSACRFIRYRAGRFALLPPVSSGCFSNTAVKSQRRLDGCRRHVTPGEITSVKDRLQPYGVLHA